MTRAPHEHMSKGRTRAVVIHLDRRAPSGPNDRTAEARLEEAVGLAAAIDLDIVAAEILRVAEPRPATLIGSGKVDQVRLALDVQDPRPELVIIDGVLSPIQHRNLERAWEIKILDRTALILEIFGDRAQTSEGRLQVELAHLTYQKSRLVRSWTHLERQRGGAGFLGGPGETQKEVDRRILTEKIDKLKRQLEDVRRTRTLQRAKRKRAPHPIVALVGYTNAGKSTLFNRLTRSQVAAKDLLFATLDPTMRAVDLDSATRVIVSDTVGFISDLPTQLVAAFRATLEEVLEADIILHVRDASHEDSEAQREDVLGVLRALGLDEEDERPVIEVMNKIDRLDPDDAAALTMSCRAARYGAEATLYEPSRVAVSAITGAGLDNLVVEIDRLLTAGYSVYRASAPAEAGAARAWLHAHGQVIETEDAGMTVRLSDQAAGQFRKAFDAPLTPAPHPHADALRRA